MQQAFEHAATRVTALDLAWEWLHRLVALYCLAFGVFYWTRLIGIYPDDLWRFDLMAPHWRVAAVSLAVLFPFAASGLWMLASWGAAVWVLCALMEATMYVGFPDLFGNHWERVSIHLGVAIIYIAMRIAFYLRARKQEE